MRRFRRDLRRARVRAVLARLFCQPPATPLGKAIRAAWWTLIVLVVLALCTVYWASAGGVH